MRKFNYDIVSLIEYIRDRPCIWDKKNEMYKDRIERRVAWEEIFALLDPAYEDMSEEDKRLTGDVIITKWANMRDTFIKSLKPHLGKPKKKYIYYEHLKFLTDNYPVDECNASLEYCTDGNESQDTSKIYKAELDSDSEEEKEKESRKRRKKIKIYAEEPPRKSKKSDSDDYEAEYLDAGNSENNIDFVSVEAPTSSRLMNEDEAFFASLLPTVVKYDEDERLEFRIEVLNLMKKIKVKRQSSSF